MLHSATTHTVADCTPVLLRCSVVDSAPTADVRRPSVADCTPVALRFSVVFRCSAPNCNRAANRCSVIFRCSAPDCNRAALRCYIADRTPIVHCCSIVDSALTKESRRSCANISSTFHHATKTPLITTRQNLHQ